MDLWEHTLNGMAYSPDIHLLEKIFSAQIENSTVMKSEWNHYDRQPEGSPDKSYGFLWNAVERYLIRTRQKENRRQGAQKLTTQNSSAAAAVGLCYGWTREGQCPRGKGCQYEHPADQKGKDSGKGKGKSKDRGKSLGTSKGKGKKGKGKGGESFRFCGSRSFRRRVQCFFTWQDQEQKADPMSVPREGIL